MTMLEEIVPSSNQRSGPSRAVGIEDNEVPSHIVVHKENDVSSTRGNTYLNCMYVNARSLTGTKDKLEILATSKQYDIIGITETWWDEYHDWTDNLEGYTLFRRDRLNKRVEVYVFSTTATCQHTCPAVGDEAPGTSTAVPPPPVHPTQGQREEEKPPGPISSAARAPPTQKPTPPAQELEVASSESDRLVIDTEAEEEEMGEPSGKNDISYVESGEEEEEPQSQYSQIRGRDFSEKLTYNVTLGPIANE
ncbi:uncharacterized protein LOC135050885 [Pseudophryne corroboree]|uniref:uncharacterized protein LOC135050885 n=1 Tax=Pseudophryne corroboree TaxID=495146 RepID=UPI00308199C1